MGKPTNIEAYAPQLLLFQLGITKQKPDQKYWDLYKKDIRDGYGALCNGGSFNHQQMLHAVRLWDASQPEPPAVAWWVGYFQQQLGLQTPAKGEETMGFFAGTEPFSPSYEPFRWGSVLAVRQWALEKKNNQLMSLTSGYAQVVCTLCALTAVPMPDKVRYWNQNKKKLVYTGPYVSPVGERSNEHAVSDQSPLFGWSVGWDFQLLSPQDWPLQIAGLLKGDLGVGNPLANQLQKYVKDNPGALAPLAGALTKIKVMAEEHVVRWKEGRLVWKPSRINGNTPCYLYDWFPYDTQTATLAYPWPSGRGFNVKGAGQCSVDTSGGGRTVRAQTDYCGGDQPACPFQALPPETPLAAVTMGPQGLMKGSEHPVPASPAAPTETPSTPVSAGL